MYSPVFLGKNAYLYFAGLMVKHADKWSRRARYDVDVQKNTKYSKHGQKNTKIQTNKLLLIFFGSPTCSQTLPSFRKEQTFPFSLPVCGRPLWPVPWAPAAAAAAAAASVQQLLRYHGWSVGLEMRKHARSYATVAYSV
jgi:hypothetical protein